MSRWESDPGIVAWVVSSLREEAKELRDSERRARQRFAKSNETCDRWREPANFVADAYGAAACELEARAYRLATLKNDSPTAFPSEGA